MLRLKTSYNAGMKFKLAILIISLPLLLVSAGCSPLSTPTPAQAPPDNQHDAIDSTSGSIPIAPPTYTVPQPANINPGKFLGTVYISDKDRKFHRAGCPNLATMNTPIARESAIIQGYTACPVCNP
jgi:hypothetical protein